MSNRMWATGSKYCNKPCSYWVLPLRLSMLVHLHTYNFLLPASFTSWGNQYLKHHSSWFHS